MTKFIIMKYFPKSDIEFDQRFLNESFMFVNKLANDVARKKIKNIRKLRPDIKKLGG
jgi:hypothetical protein